MAAHAGTARAPMGHLCVVVAVRLDSYVPYMAPHARLGADARVFSYLLRPVHTLAFICRLFFLDAPLHAPLDARLDADEQVIS